MEELVECMMFYFPIHGSLRSTRSHPTVRSCGPQQKNNKTVSLSFRMEEGGGGKRYADMQISSHLRSEHEMNTITPDPRFGARSIDGSKRIKDIVHTSDEKRCHWPCYLDFEKKRN